MLFRAEVQLQYFYPGCKANLFSPLFSILFSTTVQVTIMVVLLHGFMEDLVTAVIEEVFITLSFCLKHSIKC